jgi:hypothetical protein
MIRCFRCAFFFVTTGLDPVVHADVWQPKPRGESFRATLLHGLPDQKGVHARLRRAMSGNDDAEIRSRGAPSRPSVAHQQAKPRRRFARVIPKSGVRFSDKITRKKEQGSGAPKGALSNHVRD